MQPRFAENEKPWLIAVLLGDFPSGAQQLHQPAKPARIQQGQRFRTERKEVHPRAGGLVLSWDAGFGVLEGFRVVAPQHLQMCVDHSVKCGRASIAQAADRLARSRTGLPVLLSPGVESKPDVSAQPLGPR